MIVFCACNTTIISAYFNKIEAISCDKKIKSENAYS